MKYLIAALVIGGVGAAGVALTSAASRERTANYRQSVSWQAAPLEMNQPRDSYNSLQFASALLRIEPASWRQPANSEKHLEKQLRRHRIRLSSDATLWGRLSIIDPTSGKSIAIRDVQVYFVRNGRIAGDAKPNEDGEFRVSGLTQGSFSLIAAGADGFVAYGVDVVDPMEDGASVTDKAQLLQVAFQEPNSRLAVDGAAVPPTNFNALLQLISKYLPQNSAADWLGGQSPPISDPAPAADPAPAPNKNLVRPGLEKDGTRRPNVASTVHRHAVYLDSKGWLRGRVQRIHSRPGQHRRIHGTVVYLMQQDQQFGAPSPVDQWGNFTVERVTPGVYSLAALGSDGFAAFSFLAVSTMQEKDSSINPRNPAQLVSNARQVDPNSFDLELALMDPQDFGALRQIIGLHLPGGLANASGGSDQSGGGGGGGGSSNPGLAAALLGAAAATTSNQPASPFGVRR